MGLAPTPVSAEAGALNQRVKLLVGGNILTAFLAVHRVQSTMDGLLLQQSHLRPTSLGEGVHGGRDDRRSPTSEEKRILAFPASEAQRGRGGSVLASA